MINISEVLETNNMVAHEKLDVRTITMGISLLDCADSDLNRMNARIYNKITTFASFHRGRDWARVRRADCQ